MMQSRLLWHHDKEPRFDGLLEPSSAQFHLWLAQIKHDHGDFGRRELAQMEIRTQSMASRSRVMFNPFTGEFRRI